MIDDVLLDAEDRMEKAVVALRRELATIRTGRAHPGLVEHLRVDYYGAPTPLNQLATISVPEPRLLTIQPWDRQALSAIEKAIQKSDLGLNPMNDGNIVLFEDQFVSDMYPVTLTRPAFAVTCSARNLYEVARMAAGRVGHVVRDYLGAVAARAFRNDPPGAGPTLLLTNLTGHPVVVLPNGFREDGTPVSITFIGNLFKESDALSVAKVYQDATGFHLQHPKLTR